MTTAMTMAMAGLLSLSSGHATSPAASLPTPEPERCIGFIPSFSPDGEETLPEGLTYEQVTQGLDRVLQTALRCPRPPQKSKLSLTFLLTIGCDGTISDLQVQEGDGAPEGYLNCVAEVIRRADFPAHDMEDGMPVTYPVNVAW